MELNADNYFSLEAQNEYMGSTQYKGFLQCEACEMAKLSGEWVQEQIDAFLQGHYVHAWNEGKLDKFKVDHPEMFSSRGKTEGDLKAGFKICDKVIETISTDRKFMQALAGHKEVILTGVLFGIPWKIMIDSYFADELRLGDLKCLKSIDDKFWNKDLQLYENVFEHYGYFTQLALYSKIEAIAKNRPEGEYCEPFIAVATKEKYPDKAIVSFTSTEESHNVFIERELISIEKNIGRIVDVKHNGAKPRRCEKCDYCKSTKELRGTVHYTNFNLY